MVKIKAFRADLEPEETARYIQGHQNVLKAYGVTHVTSADVSWKDEPYTYVIIVENYDTGEVLGGGRVQLVGGTIPLPIETAIDQMDPRIFDMVKEKAKYGTGEYCGLWNSRKIAGYGLGSVILMRIGVVVINQLKINSLFAFASPATLKRSMSIGYQIITSLGINGTFYYPKEDLLATALYLDDPAELKYADSGERDIILSLRKNPIQKRILQGKRGEIEVAYDLRLR